MSGLARWHWPVGVEACLLPLPPGLRGEAARRHWQQHVGGGPFESVLRDGARVGWRDRHGRAYRVAYGHAEAQGAGAVLLAWRDVGLPAWDWAVDCCADRPLPEGPDLLRLYGAPPDDDFPRAWAALEARAKLGGGLREGAALPPVAGLHLHRVPGWVLALAWRPQCAPFFDGPP